MNRQPLVSRRLFAGSAAMAVATLAFPALRAQSRLEKSKISLAVGGKSAFFNLPLTIAEQLGYFKAEGLDMEVSDFSDDASAMHATVGAAADVCSGAFEQIISLQSKSQMFQSFVLLGRAPQIALGVSSKNMPDYKSIADLRGKKIGVSSPSSSSRMLAHLVLARGGLNASDVSFMAVGSSAGALAALRSGLIDAISNTDPVMTILEQKGDVKIISDTRTLKGTTEVFGGPMPASCLYASAGFVQKNPNTCQAMANAIVHGLKWLQTAGPGDIIKTMPESYLMADRALYLASFNKVRESISPDGIMHDEAARTALKALASLDSGIRTAKIDLDKTYTNAFAIRAKERFRA
ncbi:MAG: ABC transporter substrate-binding protein [Polaromonas sp.]|nr:ABC transporter substrate-binding protein [Polaromonas sp.]